jgi:hypothetical protein
MIWLIFFLILQTKLSFCRLFACSQLGFPAVSYVEAATMTAAPSHVLSPEYTEVEFLKTLWGLGTE